MMIENMFNISKELNANWQFVKKEKKCKPKSKVTTNYEKYIIYSLYKRKKITTNTQIKIKYF